MRRSQQRLRRRTNEVGEKIREAKKKYGVLERSDQLSQKLLQSQVSLKTKTLSLDFCKLQATLTLLSVPAEWWIQKPDKKGGQDD